jgi:Fe-S-cluster containining protein
MNSLLDRYGVLLRQVDNWFRRCFEQHPDHIACRNGCSECCRGLFDITLLDAFYLKQGFDRLPDDRKTGLTRMAEERLKELSGINPLFVEPWLLNILPEDDWDPLMPEEDVTPCLLLSEHGGCLVYEHRPMTCRLNGIPLIDVSGEEMFDEWCSLNFTTADPRQLTELRFEFRKLFSDELLLFQEFVHHLTGSIRNEVDLFIPAVLVMDQNKIVHKIGVLNQYC